MLPLATITPTEDLHPRIPHTRGQICRNFIIGVEVSRSLEASSECEPALLKVAPLRGHLTQGAPLARENPTPKHLVGFEDAGAAFRDNHPEVVAPHVVFLSQGFRVQVSGFRVQSSGFRVQGSGFRVQGSGFRVQGEVQDLDRDRRDHE